MRLRPKEKAKLDSRRKLWKIMGWYWAYKKDEDENRTLYTSDENDGNGYGFFKHHHSVSCDHHGICRLMLYEKKMNRRRKRKREKNEVREIVKIVNSQGRID